MSTEECQARHHRLFLNLFAVLIILLGFAWRAGYLRQAHPYIDEYYTILAAEMVQQHGLPLLPSGLFYSHGFLYTYLIAALGWLLKVVGPAAGILQADMIYRVPNLLISALSMAVIFSTTKQWFGPRAALIALAFLAVYPHGIVWGARVRMYTLVYLVAPLVVYAVYRSITHPHDKRWYVFTLFLLSLSLIVHNWMMILIPVLVAGGGLVVWGRGVTAARSWRWWLPAGLVIVLAAGLSARLQSFGFAVTEEPPPGAGWQGVMLATLGRLNPVAGLAANADFLREFISTNPFNLVVFGLTLLGAAGLIWLFRDRQQRVIKKKYGWPLLYLYLLLVGLLAEFLLLLKPELKQARYASPMLLLAFMILGGWAEIGVNRFTDYRRRRPESGQVSQQTRLQPNRLAYLLVVVILAGCGLLAARQLPKIFFEGLPAVAYERAFQFVKTNFGSDDTLLSPLPAAAHLYLDDPGYFVAQDANYKFVHSNTDDVLADRWVGAPWLNTAQKFKAVLRNSPHTWLVADSLTLESQFYSDWKQIMRYNMVKLWEEDGVLVFAGEGLIRDIPTEPEMLVGVVLADKLELVGYSRSFPPGQMELVLFWQVLNELPADYTTFVHIRNQAGETVAQIDVQPLAGEYPTSRWRVGETVIDEIVVPLPAELPRGNYRLLVGLYRWDTLERLAVANDTTGENAIELERLVVP